ncbi:small acid-soluble spore protein P [Paenibacillus sp. MMS18-CY102]|uniref:small acid-soluble spore protein P n=1 Tax=Paenibacillus sp. MMS18-CY102 TaxID=2682849 RepID=UPI001365D57E|nr:small acid-soluble spore protein P [Paenibacillus sp. MMS18-CY102]MWC30707.1 small acid-soluble spore protein P [Paenibacillus sp. MMS18-CY102]
MSKPDSVPVPTPESDSHRSQSRDRSGNSPQKPLSGSKKTKQQNHSRHNNGEG